jgi:hypothetical protein
MFCAHANRHTSKDVDKRGLRTLHTGTKAPEMRKGMRSEWVERQTQAIPGTVKSLPLFLVRLCQTPYRLCRFISRARHSAISCPGRESSVASQAIRAYKTQSSLRAGFPVSPLYVSLRLGRRLNLENAQGQSGEIPKLDTSGEIFGAVLESLHSFVE